MDKTVKMEISEESLRDMQMEAKFQTQLLTQQGMWYQHFLFTFRYLIAICLKVLLEFLISFIS